MGSAPETRFATPLEPRDTEELCRIAREADSIVPGKSIILSNFDKVSEYLPDEYTITIEAGAKLADVKSLLAEHGQYLPFDPPFASDGATIGSLIASGLSGPSGFRYGILRDFILGVTLIDGLGNEIHGGGKVVKNAAGFDLPKFVVGSFGSCGIITEATFKVFPKPPASRTAIFSYDSLDLATSCLKKISRSRFTVDALELVQNKSIHVRLSGIQGALSSRAEGIETLLDREASETIEDDDEIWDDLREFKDFPKEGRLLKLPIRPSDIPQIESLLKGTNSRMRYGLGGSVAWIQSNEEIASLSDLFEKEQLAAQVIRGDCSGTLIGSTRNKVFHQRVKSALDPKGKFPNLYA